MLEIDTETTAATPITMLKAVKVTRTGRLVSAAALALFFGAFVFGAALYLLAITGLGWLGVVAPVGGVLMVAGWGLVLAAGVDMLSRRRP